MTRKPRAAAVFASGGGSNFQALLDHAENGATAWRVAVLITNREAGAMDRARAAGVPVALIPTRDRRSEDVAGDTLEVLREHEVEIILLAGYLRLLPAQVVRAYAGRILNVHPALLPEFGGEGMYGLHVHRAVLASGAARSGASVHFVDEVYDRGAVLVRMTVPVEPDDTPEALAARVLVTEHALYPAAVDHLCAALDEGRRPERIPDRTNDEPIAPSPIEQREESG